MKYLGFFIASPYELNVTYTDRQNACKYVNIRVITKLCLKICLLVIIHNIVAAANDLLLLKRPIKPFYR